MADRPTGPDEPELPALRRFRFPDGTPGNPVKPAESAASTPDEVPADSDRPGQVAVPEAELTDTFDETELGDAELEYDDAPTNWLPATPVSPPVGHFGVPPVPSTAAGPRPTPPRPGTGPVPPPWPGTGPITGTQPLPPTSSLSAVQPPARRSRRTPLIIAAIVAVVAIAAITILIIRPFDSEPTGSADRPPGAVNTTAPSTSADQSSDRSSSSEGTQPSGIPGIDPTGSENPGAGGNWAAQFCGAVSDFDEQATKLTGTADSAVQLALKELQRKAKTLLSDLDASLGGIATADTPDAQKLQSEVQQSAADSANALEASPEGGTELLPAQTKILIRQSLAGPVTTFTSSLKAADAPTQGLIEQQPSCAKIIEASGDRN